MPEPQSVFARHPSLPRGMAIGGWLVVTVAIWASLLVWVMRGLPSLPMSFGHGPGFLALGVLAFVYGTVGALLAARRPANVIGWLFLVTGIVLSLTAPLTLAVADTIHTFRPIPASTVILVWAISALTAPLAAGIAFGVALIFPGGRPPGAWRLLVVLLVVASLLLTAASALNPSGILWYPTLPNPLPIAERFGWDVLAVRVAAVVLSVLSMLAVATSLPIRYRRSDPTLRHQLRWIIAAIAILPPTVAPLFLARYVLGADAGLGEALMVLAAIGGSAFPVAVAIAIMRHHLFGIERFVERALVYVPLMGILGGLYTASLALFQRAFVAVTGYTSDASIVLSTLILASAFTPIRQALERAADRRFSPKGGRPMAEVEHEVPDEVPDPRRGTDPPRLVRPPSDPDSIDSAVTAIARQLASLETRLARLEATSGTSALAPEQTPDRDRKSGRPAPPEPADVASGGADALDLLDGIAIQAYETGSAG